MVFRTDSLYLHSCFTEPLLYTPSTKPLRCIVAPDVNEAVGIGARVLCDVGLVSALWRLKHQVLRTDALVKQVVVEIAQPRALGSKRRPREEFRQNAFLCNKRINNTN